jgi:hypothetical protein
MNIKAMKKSAKILAMTQNNNEGFARVTPCCPAK